MKFHATVRVIPFCLFLYRTIICSLPNHVWLILCFSFTFVLICFLQFYMVSQNTVFNSLPKHVSTNFHNSLQGLNIKYKGISSLLSNDPIILSLFYWRGVQYEEDINRLDWPAYKFTTGMILWKLGMNF